MAKQGRQRKSGRSGSGFFFGLMVGIGIGALLALLFAPQSGEEARTSLDDQSLGLRTRGQERYGQLAQQLRERYNDALAQGREVYARTRDEVLTRYNQNKSK